MPERPDRPTERFTSLCHQEVVCPIGTDGPAGKGQRHQRTPNLRQDGERRRAWARQRADAIEHQVGYGEIQNYGEDPSAASRGLALTTCTDQLSRHPGRSIDSDCHNVNNCQ